MGRRVHGYVAIFTFVIGLLTAASGRAADDALQAAKDLYAAAAYEDALLALARVEATTADRARQVEEYRAFCLYALGRGGEAEQVVESLIRRQPLALLESTDVSPRLQQMFNDVRQRLLPQLIRERLQSARAALEVKRFDGAEPPLLEAALMIVEVQKRGVRDPALDDMSLIVDGYLQLIRTAGEQRAAPPPAAVAAGPAGAADTAAATRPPLPTATPPPATPAPALEADTRPAAAPASGPRVYTADDAGVVPPVTIAQTVPQMPQSIYAVIKAKNLRGMLEFVIDESGRVLSATMRQPVNAFFDTLILRAARDWRYEPARREGVPVRYLKTLTFSP